MNDLAELIGPVYLLLAYSGICFVFGYAVCQVVRELRHRIRQQRIAKAIAETQVQRPERWDAKYRRPQRARMNGVRLP